MGLENLALFAASTSGFLPGLLSCTEISLLPGTSARLEMENAQISFAVPITLGFLSLILNQTLLYSGVSTHISLVCIYLPLLPL